MSTLKQPCDKFPTPKMDIKTDEETKIYSVVASFLENNNFIIQLTLGNHIPDYDNVRLMKMFVCNDEEETQRSLAMIMADRNSFYNRLFQ